MKPADAKPAEAKSAKVVPLRRGRDDLEFLPAALEIIETPASPLPRAIAASIVGFLVIAIGWACIGRIDIIATAQGKIVPTGRVKVIQPLETGIVSAIHVADGDRVREGQVLIEMDQTASRADRDRARYDLMQARLDAARLSALRAGIDDNYAPAELIPPSGTPAHDVARTRATMQAQADQQIAKVASLDQQIAQKNAEADSIKAAIDKIEAGLPFLADTADIRKKAMQIEYGNRIAYLDAAFRLSDQNHELVTQRRRAVEVEAARKALEAGREQARAEYARGIVSDLADAEHKAAQSAQDLIKAEKKMQDQVLRAPMDGTVQQLAIHTVGGVATPAQALMVVVPSDARIEVEAMVLNSDIGFVHDGDAVEIKVDTFNFAKYGLLHGRVVSVSRDAIVRDKATAQADARQSGQTARSSEPPGRELLYSARITLDQTRMQVEDRIVDLAPGMAVTAEIKTGRRRIIEYLLSPLVRYKQESMRER